MNGTACFYRRLVQLIHIYDLLESAEQLDHSAGDPTIKPKIVFLFGTDILTFRFAVHNMK